MYVTMIHAIICHKRSIVHNNYLFYQEGQIIQAHLEVQDQDYLVHLELLPILQLLGHLQVENNCFSRINIYFILSISRTTFLVQQYHPKCLTLTIKRQ